VAAGPPSRVPPTPALDADSGSTLLTPRPEITDDAAAGDGRVFEEAAPAAGRRLSEEVSLIEAIPDEATEALSARPEIDSLPPAPTDIRRLAYSAVEEIEEDASSIEVRKWKAGAAGEAPNVFEVPRTLEVPRTDAEPPAAATRVDRHEPAPSPRFDIDELRRSLEEAQRLLRTVKSQASGLDLEARGMNAQLAAALHRLEEALAMLKRDP
jgi:hypothetical protein